MIGIGMVRAMLIREQKRNLMHSSWLTTRELATLLNVSIKTIRRAYRNGLIPVQRLGRMVRFDLDQVKQALKRNAQDGTPRVTKKREERRVPAGCAGGYAKPKSPRSVKRGRNFQGASRRGS